MDGSVSVRVRCALEGRSDGFDFFGERFSYDCGFLSNKTSAPLRKAGFSSLNDEFGDVFLALLRAAKDCCEEDPTDEAEGGTRANAHDGIV